MSCDVDATHPPIHHLTPRGTSERGNCRNHAIALTTWIGWVESRSVDGQSGSDPLLPQSRVSGNFIVRHKLHHEHRKGTHMKPGDKVENFTLQNQDGKDVSLTDFKGKPVVLFFYPRADTPGCTIESCGFRDAFEKFQKAGIVVLGI